MDSFPAAAPVTIYPRGILFDMDGVLVSSIGSVERTWEKWALARGIDPEAAIRMAHGRRAIETVRQLRPDLNDVEELQWLEEMEVADKLDVSILDGVRPILESLPAEYWTVVTSATDRLARSRMQYGGIRVPVRIVSADDVQLGKPHPEPYRMGAEILGLAPEDCLVIEDSASGAEAGHAAGCTVLATLFSHSVESLIYADHIVRSLEDVYIRVPEETGAPLAVRFTPIARDLQEAVR
ncbi:MAG TPA: HAD-IA family hydrolase [Acidobacteriaceae bacterium]|jgi:sugar-phosphatase